MPIPDWIKENFVAILIGVITLVSTYTLYGYRLDALEKETAQQQIAITALNSTGVETRISLAQIQTDIQYIKEAINKLTK